MNSQIKTPYFSDWPKIQSAIAPDPTIERKIVEILSQMTLEEKIGQMVQPEIRGVTAEELKQFKIGSILNGGGAWPNEDKHASALDWASKSDEFWHATQEMYADRPFTIPFMWATDAVHGHNNVYGATVFPHNIGLGCARDPELIERIGRVTALEIVATGLDWTFAPTVATPRDLRWGRVYEGYSEDPQITYQYARAMVQGLQGTSEDLKGDEHVISNVKHWVGDGGTTTGVDRGINHYSEDLLRNIHAMGYFSGLEAGAQVVMSSFNSWVSDANYDQDEGASEQYNYKVHGSKYLINDVLKEKMGFDGLVVTDWHGHAEVNKCTDGDANYAINAGNDVLMVPIRHHWQAVYRSAVQGVRDGSISMSRIDDAVTRILRVKMRANLWHKPAPTERRYGGKQAMLGALNHREVAREAVRKSMVLLKNKQGILPLKQNQTVLLTGSAANDIQKQSGGWNLTWQGDENDLSDFPGATTLKMALEQTLGKDNVRFDPDLTSQLKAGDVAVVAFGEDPYAEMMGDIKAWQTLEYARLKRSYARDCQLISQLHDAGVKVISIFFSGRPLYLNEEISKSDAFVAAFLPGSEGEGMTDVLVANAQGEPSHDFVGQLSYSWPNKKSSATVNTLPVHIPNYQVPENEQSPLGEHAPLFNYGYGLNYSDRIQENDLDNLTLDIANDAEVENATHAEHLYGIRATIGDYQLKVADATHWMGVDVSRNNAMELDEVLTKPYNYQQQQDAVELTLTQGGSYVYIQTGDGLAADFSQFKRHGSVSFEIKLLEVPSEPLYLGVQRASSPELQSSLEKYDLSPLIGNQMGEFITLRIECADLLSDDSNFTALDTPFVLFTEGSARFVLANICWNAS